MNEKQYECAIKVKNNQTPCKQKECRHFLQSSKNLNCSIIAAENGPMTLRQIAERSGISFARVKQIETKALLKMKNGKKLSCFEN